MEQLNVKNIWGDVALYGGLIGLLVVAFEVFKVLFGLHGVNSMWLVSILEFFAMTYLIFLFSKKRSEQYGDAGYTYAQNLGYVLLMMLFAGIVYGVGSYLMQNFLFREYYTNFYAESFETIEELTGMADTDQALSMMQRFMRNPIFLMFAGVINMFIYGGLIGLFISAVVKRRPNIFTDNQ